MDPHALSFYALAQFNSESHQDVHHPTQGYEDLSVPRYPGPVADEVASRLKAIRAPLRPRSEDASPRGPLTDDTPIPLVSRVTHKFYEPVMLLVSLIDVIKERPSQPQVVETSLSGNDNDMQEFKAFVNKLAHVCSSSKGRETVTSFLVLRDKGDRVHYWFAANDQKWEDLVDMQTYVHNLLRKVGQASGSGSDAVRKELHRDVLVFNRPRISSYLRDIQQQTEKCLQRCALEKTDESKS